MASTHLLTPMRNLSNIGRDLAHGRGLLLQTKSYQVGVSPRTPRQTQCAINLLSSLMNSVAHLLMSSSFKSNVAAMRLARPRRSVSVAAMASSAEYDAAIECGQSIEATPAFQSGPEPVIVRLSMFSTPIRETSVYRGIFRPSVTR